MNATRQRLIRTAQQLLAAAGIALLTACAGLPAAVQRPVSEAATDVADTRLAGVAAASLPQADASGLRLLPDGTQALEARLALAAAAQKTIDAQYYQVADDATGREFLRALADAAARGVRVRLLIDDLYAAGQDTLLAGLAARANVEVRMFNPLAQREGGLHSRVVLSLHEFSRINRRMHNKLFVADNSFAISGGRNIADAYFGRSKPANFIDMDLLAAGPAVAELSRVFDLYWNSEQAWPIQALAAAEPEAARRAFDEATAGAAVPTAEVAARDALGQGRVGAQIAARRVELHSAQVRVVADAPAKAAAAGSLADGAVMQANLEMLEAARADILVASPYFVPGSRTLEVLKQAQDGRVQVSVMTNSLATTDEPLVHFGYARYRKALLAMGVKLYELMPGQELRQTAKGEHSASLGRLHAKLAVVDRRFLSIGSMNMDRRSAHSNTEIGLVIDSPVLAGQATELLQSEQLAKSYQLRSAGAEQQAIEWTAQQGDQQLMFAAEPDAGWMQQLGLSVASLFISEDWL